MQNKVFVRIAFATGLILLIPFSFMQLQVQLPDQASTPSEINWDLTDFIAMGTLIFGISSLFVLGGRKVHKQYRLVIGVISLILFLWLWAELAVGLFTNWGS